MLFPVPKEQIPHFAHWTRNVFLEICAMHFRPVGRDVLAMMLGVSLATIIVGSGALGMGIIPIDDRVHFAELSEQTQ